jgi:uncharacterized LabA/DUF88 family protein
MQATEQIAVFLDIENFIGLSNGLSLPIDLNEILEKLKEEGRIIIRRSFGDLVKSLGAIGQHKEADNVRRMLRDNLFIHEDIAYRNQFKNSADMRLAVEMLYTAFTVPTISKFAVIAGDTDYAPVFQKLQEQNKMVIGISGTESGTSVIYRRACDTIYYFDDLSRRSIDPLPLPVGQSLVTLPTGELPKRETIVDQSTARVDNGVPSQRPTDTEMGSSASYPVAVPAPTSRTIDYHSIRDEYANLLVRAVKILEQSGNQPTIPTISVQMRQLQSDFDYERAGFDTLQDLIRFAADQGLVSFEKRAGAFFVFLSGSDALADREISTALYRKSIQERMKCQLPPASTREAICKQAFKSIGFSLDDGGILLRDLSMDVTDELSLVGLNVPQPEVYKYLFNLYRSRCFHFEDSIEGGFNPVITGYNAQAQEWDDRFLLGQIRQLVQDGLPIVPQKISTLFYETEVKTMHIKRLLDKNDIRYQN